MMKPGVHVAIITPMYENETVDHESFINLVKHLDADKSCQGIVIFGSTGEGSSLSIVDKINVMKTLSGIEHTLQIAIGIGGINTKEIIRFALEALEFFPEAILMMAPPPYVKATQKSIIKHYTNVFSDPCINTCKFMVYNIPSRTGTKIEFDTLKLLSEKFSGRFVAYKDATGNTELTKKISNAKLGFDIFCGDDNLYRDYIIEGAVGLVSVYGNFSCNDLNLKFDEPIIKMFKSEVSDLLDWISKENPRRIKYLLYKAGIITHYSTMTPLYSASDLEMETLTPLFDTYNKIQIQMKRQPSLVEVYYSVC